LKTFPQIAHRVVATRYGPVSVRDSIQQNPTPAHAGALLFLHGLSGNSASFGWQFDALAADYRCIAWDAPGYGQTAISESTVSGYAAQAHALLQALDINAAVVVGHSMGGVIAGKMAAEYDTLIKGAVLSCTHTGYGMPADAPMTEGHERRVREVAELEPLEYGRARAADMLSPETGSPIAEVAATLASATTASGLKSAIKTIFCADTTEDVKQISCPCVVVAGEHDRIAPTDKTDRLASLITNSHRVQLPATGHAPYLEKSDAFNQVVRDIARRSFV